MLPADSPLPSNSSMKDKRTLRSQNHQFLLKSNSMASKPCDVLPLFYFSLGHPQYKTLYELLTAIFHGLVATHSPFASQTRHAMKIVDELATISTSQLAAALQYSLQHQMAIPLSQPSCQPHPIPVPAPITVCKAPTIADDALFSSFLDSTRSQLEHHISSLEMLASLSEQLLDLKTSSTYRSAVLAVTKAQAARTAAETELAEVIEQNKAHQNQFKHLLCHIPVTDRAYKRSELEASIISLAVNMSPPKAAGQGRRNVM